MLNTDDLPSEPEIDVIVQAGAGGALMLAGIATAVVVGLWLLFYLVVFLPRAVAP